MWGAIKMWTIKRMINKLKYKSLKKRQRDCKHTFKFYSIENTQSTFSVVCTKCGYIDYGKRRGM
jgi:hypothetical protein